MGRQPPCCAHESRAIDAGHVGARLVAGADVARHGAALDAGADLFERAHAAPAIGHAAHLLPDLVIEIERPPHPPIEAGAGGVRVAAIGRRRDPPLDAFERNRGLDHALARQRAHGRDRPLAGRAAHDRWGGRRRRAHVDRASGRHGAEAEAEHVDRAALGAQKIDITGAGHRHEAARERHVAQRQFVDALERAGRRMAGDERRRPPRARRQVLDEHEKAAVIVDFEEFDRAEPIAHPEVDAPNRRAVHLAEAVHLDQRARFLSFRDHVCDYRPGAAGGDVLALARPRLFAFDGAGVLVEQLDFAAGILRAHLGEGRGGEFVVGRPRAHLLQLADRRFDAAERGRVWRVGSGLQRVDRAVPDHDVGLAHHQVGRLQFVRQAKQLRVRADIARVESHDAIIELVEQIKVAVVTGGERLGSADVGILAGVDDADRVQVGAPGKLAHNEIRGLAGARQGGQAADHAANRIEASLPILL